MNWRWLEHDRERLLVDGVMYLMLSEAVYAAIESTAGNKGGNREVQGEMTCF